DDITKTLEKEKLIDDYEINTKKKYPWLEKKNG
ncbi:MAG: hypothetical protein CFH28_00446, partial [Alphaproteobacteria bacterium MarineAlpha6_Bin6]